MKACAGARAPARLLRCARESGVARHITTLPSHSSHRRTQLDAHISPCPGHGTLIQDCAGRGYRSTAGHRIRRCRIGPTSTDRRDRTALPCPTGAPISRVYSGYDIRAGETGYQQTGACLTSDQQPGVIHRRHSDAQWSFGRERIPGQQRHDLCRARRASMPNGCLSGGGCG